MLREGLDGNRTARRWRSIGRNGRGVDLLSLEQQWKSIDWDRRGTERRGRAGAMVRMDRDLNGVDTWRQRIAWKRDAMVLRGIAEGTKEQRREARGRQEVKWICTAGHRKRKAKIGRAMELLGKAAEKQSFGSRRSAEDWHREARHSTWT